MDKRKALGRGLGALIPNIAPAAGSIAGRGEAEGEVAVHQRPLGAPPTTTALPEGTPPVRTVRREFFLCPIEEIAPSRDNPRQRFDEQRLAELADSIKAQGLVQPLVVRLRGPEEMPQGEGPSFELIAGARRWRAAQRAGLKDVPVVVREVSAAQAFELALVENLQREDLSAIEEAEAYRRLSEEFGYTQEQLAVRVGRARETVANSLRLLRLPDRVREQVATGVLSAGHARTLLGLDDPSEIERGAEAVLKRHLSVRQTEDLVRRTRREQGRPREKAQPQAAASTPAIRDVEDRLQKALGTRVQLRPKDKRSGHIEVHYHSLDELDRLIAQLTGERDEM
jgi:ParB family chromosome partitioning protein